MHFFFQEVVHQRKDCTKESEFYRVGARSRLACVHVFVCVCMKELEIASEYRLTRPNKLERAHIPEII